MSCVCGKGPSTEECCKPIIDGERQAETAEDLMRSRYAAYVLEEIDYVVESHAPEGRDEIDREGAEKWAKEADWEGLEIVSTEAGGPEDDTGKVEFIAHYAVGGGSYAHHEMAEFEKIDGRWYYSDGEMVKAKPVRRAERKVGRNEPCPCGSGKKYKKCCGAA